MLEWKASTAFPKSFGSGQYSIYLHRTIHTHSVFKGIHIQMHHHIVQAVPLPIITCPTYNRTTQSNPKEISYQKQNSDNSKQFIHFQINRCIKPDSDI